MSKTYGSKNASFFSTIRNSNSVSSNAMCCGGIRIRRKCGGVTYRKVVGSVGQGYGNNST